MKTIAMFLPQFHRVKENDEWWGEGYTDWMAVKNAQKLFDEHYQPREPLQENYYDLLDKKTFEWQAGLMHKYDIDGLCFYHYYFKDGKKILEKPAENLLQWKDVDMPFCFCWDNTPWARTWSTIGEKAIWSDKYEKKYDQEGNGILLEQSYGGEKEWREHFQYLLPFFRDDRYIKKNGKPVFLFYRPNQIFCLAEMAAYWNQMARENGFDGVYLIGTNMSKNKKGLDAILICGPNMYWNSDFFGNNIQAGVFEGIRYYEYEELWKNAISAKPINNTKTYYGGFIDYDDTPRRGENGTFLRNVSVDTFRKYWYALVRKNMQAGNEFVFLNAFNEWGEGGYLEPDKERGYSFLEAVAYVKKQIKSEEIQGVNVIDNSIVEGKHSDQTEELLKMRLDKFKGYFYLLNRWLELKESNRSLVTYFHLHNCHRISIYGFGVLGKHLYEELKHSDIEIAYAIDKKTMIHPEVEVLTAEETLPEVDAVIVTATFEFDEIRESLRERINAPIISLEEIVQEV